MKLNQTGGSKTDTIVKLILVFFISLLSFSVGTFVGKQFSDSQHRLASLENEYNKDSAHGRSTASIPGDGMEVEPTQILSNEDVAKLAEEFVQEKKEDHKAERKVANTETVNADINTHAAPAAANKPIEAKMPSDKAAAKVIADRAGKKVDEYAHDKKDVTQKAAEKVAANQAPLQAVKPTETKKAMADLPATVAADAKGKYTIQVSSHQNEPEAKNKVSELTGKGFVASYISANVDGKTWYRVGVGTFGTVKSAKEYLDKIKENPSFKGAIVRQIVQ